MKYELFINALLVSESNMRENRFVKAKRKKEQRQAVRTAWVAAGKPSISGPISLKLTRVVPARRFIRDYDNLVGCFKAVIDEISDICGVNDKDIRWKEDSFMQVKDKRIGCKVEIESLARLGDDLTDMQKAFFNKMLELWDARGIPPTLAEMKEHRAVGSSPQCFVQYLNDKGYINRIPGTARGIILTAKGRSYKNEFTDTR
tara:strand:- start:16236 stop:16841 length:606 start_codon:yes stop_codon:yes gene_type:complete